MKFILHFSLHDGKINFAFIFTLKDLFLDSLVFLEGSLLTFLVRVLDDKINVISDHSAVLLIRMIVPGIRNP